MQKIEDHVFLSLVVLVTIAFGWILEPFYGAILWGIVIAILFNPLHLRLRKLFGQRHNLAAAVMVLAVVAMTSCLALAAGARARRSGTPPRVCWPAWSRAGRWPRWSRLCWPSASVSL